MTDKSARLQAARQRSDSADALAHACEPTKSHLLARILKNFKKNFPDIVNDQKRFKMADDLTIALQIQHPDWSTEQICDEAGKRTREIYTVSNSSNIHLYGCAVEGKDAFGSTIEEQRLISLGRGKMTDQEQMALKQRELIEEMDRRSQMKQQQFRTDGTQFRYTNHGGTDSMISGDKKEQRILSRPVPVHWQGWETDTVRLQRAGWQLAVEFEPSRDMYSLIMNHKEMKLTAITSAIRIDHGLSMYDQRQSQFGQSPAPGVNHMPAFNVVKIAPSIENIRIQSNATWKNYQLIDAEPQLSEMTIEKIEDLNIFALAVGGAEQVVMDKANMEVVDHLEAIKDLQSDTQKELREKARKGVFSDYDRVGPPVGEVVVQLVDYQEGIRQ